MMDNPVKLDSPTLDMPPPPHYTLPLFPVRVTYVLIVLNGLFFVVDFIIQRQVYSMGALVPALVLSYNQWWRLLTAGFIHADILHIGVNLYALYGLGTLVERFYGPGRYTSIYFFSLLGANILVTLLSSWDIPTIGASGAIMGVLGAALFYFWRYRDMLRQGRRYLSELIKMALINVGIGLLPGISLWGHLGGLLVGFSMGWVLLPYYQPIGTEIRVLHVLPIKRRAWFYTLVMIIVQMGIVTLAYQWRVG
jgi:rhomboid protease GluP